MKKLLCLVAFAFVITLFGCSKRNDNNRNVGYFTAFAPGKTINTTNCHISSTGNFHVIMASWGPLSNMVINIKTSNTTPTNLATTTYLIDSSRENNTADYIPGGIGYPAKSGSVRISTIIPGVSTSGSFDLVLQDGHTVSGSFTAIP